MSTMDWEAIGNAVRSRFKTQIADVVDSGALPVLYDNQSGEEFTEPEATRWVRASVLMGESTLASFGQQNRYRTVGVLTVQIFIPLGKGDKDALSLADTIATAFRGLSASDVHYKVPYARIVGRSSKFWQVNVNCPFWADNIV